jgi:pimeloyl-ACP methyl ester carboxylesterase
MDFTGVGDSGGEIRDSDIYSFDCFDIEDTLRAVDFLTQDEMVEKVVLLGLCTGARNALKTAARDTRIDSIILWSLPFYAIPNGRQCPQSLRRTDVKHYLRQRVKKALNIRLLINYLSSHEKLSSIKDFFRDLVVGIKTGNNNNMHSEFSEAFELFLSSKRKALFVYGERDEILKKMFEEKFKELSDDKRRICEYYIVPNSDHTFSSVEAEETVIEKTAEWLVQQYGLKTKKDQRRLACPI